MSEARRVEPRRPVSAAEPAIDSRAFAIEAARLMHDRKCTDVRVIEVRGLSSVCDFIVISSGTSDRQMKTVQRELEDMGEDQGHVSFRSNTDAHAMWIVVDFIDVVAHLFEPGMRAYYDLEDLWSDGQAIAWERADDAGGEPYSRPRLVSDADSEIHDTGQADPHD